MSAKTTTPLRWSLNRIAEETGWARQTVKNRMVSSGIMPAADDTYSTAEMLRALFGDFDGEKTRKMRADADISEMERDVMRRELIRAELIESTWNEILANCRAVVLAFDLTKAQRHQLLEALRTIPLNEYREPSKSDSSDSETDA